MDWAYEGGFDPVNFLQEVGARQREIHVRSARNKIWLEDVEDSDIDYHQVAAYLKQADLNPLIVVELAYRPATSHYPPPAAGPAPKPPIHRKSFSPCFESVESGTEHTQIRRTGTVTLNHQFPNADCSPSAHSPFFFPRPEAASASHPQRFSSPSVKPA